MGGGGVRRGGGVKCLFSNPVYPPWDKKLFQLSFIPQLIDENDGFVGHLCTHWLY